MPQHIAPLDFRHPPAYISDTQRPPKDKAKRKRLHLRRMWALKYLTPSLPADCEIVEVGR